MIKTFRLEPLKHYPVKTLDRILQKLYNPYSGEWMVDLEDSWMQRGLAGDNTVTHIISLQNGYFTDEHVGMFCGQLRDIIDDIKEISIHRGIQYKQYGKTITEFELDENGKPIEFNPFLLKK
jgi:hypothetical protein